MSIVATDQTCLVGISSELAIEFQTSPQCRADVVAMKHAILRPLHLIEVEIPPLEIGELVARREIGGGLAIALDLCCLQKWFVAGTRLGVSLIHRFTVKSLCRVHLAIAQVAVVRNCEHLAAGFFRVRVHVLPEVRRILAVEGGKRNDLVHTVRVVAENDSTVEVISAWRASPLKAVQRGENARLVPFLG